MPINLQVLMSDMQKWGKQILLLPSLHLAMTRLLLIQTVDNDLTLKIHIKARVIPKIVAAFAERREFNKILIYSKQVGYMLDYLFLLQTILRSDPQSRGALNTVSWGIMMPLGFLAARYLKAIRPAADPLWFYIHIILQLSGYVIGIVGGATGFLLLNKSSGIHHPCHMGIGITIFGLGLLQVSALLLRPGKDHKYRYI